MPQSKMFLFAGVELMHILFLDVLFLLSASAIADSNSVVLPRKLC